MGRLGSLGETAEASSASVIGALSCWREEPPPEGGASRGVCIQRAARSTSLDQARRTRLQAVVNAFSPDGRRRVLVASAVALHTPAMARVRPIGSFGPFATGIVIAIATIAIAQDLPIAPGARSIEIVASGATVRAGPSVRAERRGTVRAGTRLPVLARVRGEGCPGGEWYRVGEEMFVCETLARVSAQPPAGETLPSLAPGEILPRRYAFVGVDGTWAYSRPQDYFVDEWSESLGRGFGIAITGVQDRDGVRFLRSLGGLWIPEDQVRHARGSDFEGLALEGELDVAWVARGGAIVRDDRGRELRRAGPRERVRVIEELPRGRVRIEGGIVAARELVRPTPASPPAGLTPGERWIDVQVRTQTLVVYEGERAIFATLISSGRAGAHHATPIGAFRIWVKLAEDTMDDLDRTDLESNYAIEAVPWVQYFAEGVALHAAFWHDDFGRRRSHGCVNLSPRDARRVFELTSPELPPGWDAILTTEAHPGTLVSVRE